MLGLSCKSSSSPSVQGQGGQLGDNLAVAKQLQLREFRDPGGHSPKSLNCHPPPGLWGGVAVLARGDSARADSVWADVAMGLGSIQAGAAQECAQSGVFLCPSTGTVG